MASGTDDRIWDAARGAARRPAQWGGLKPAGHFTQTFAPSPETSWTWPRTPSWATCGPRRRQRAAAGAAAEGRVQIHPPHRHRPHMSAPLTPS